ncbi:hypothetical protein HAX54_008703 [Datura stramonium]|uniref:Uncharacterized protein n=1 Tax=Datura stramonium TaxID=4076 RepID=A0ABS8RXY7_DATST|nr:hypothetical protein [Datura stramonium]
MLNTVHENSTNESNQSQEKLIEELTELKVDLVKVNKNQQALEKKVEAQFVDMKQYIVDSNFKFTKYINVLLGKGDFEEAILTDQVSEEPSMIRVLVIFVDDCVVGEEGGKTDTLSKMLGSLNERFSFYDGKTLQNTKLLVKQWTAAVAEFPP